MKKWEFVYYRYKEAIVEKLTEGTKGFMWGTVFGCILMYVMLIFVLKDASYFKGQRDGMKDLSVTIIKSIAK